MLLGADIASLTWVSEEKQLLIETVRAVPDPCKPPSALVLAVRVACESGLMWGPKAGRGKR